MEDGLRRLQEYKARIKRVYATFTAKDVRWITEVHGRDIQHFKSDTLYKMEALLACSPTRLYQLCADRHYVTRSQWDERAREMCPYQKEHYETNDGDIYVLTGDVIQWTRPNARIVMFLSSASETCTWVKQVDEKAFLIVISTTKIHWIPTDHQVIASDLTRFNQIYRPWRCEFCRKDVPAHELYCRQCKKERYKRCDDLACYEPQMQHATECWKCKREL